MMPRRNSVWIVLAAAAVLIFMNAPTVVVVLASFTKTTYLTVPPKGWTLHWFAEVLGDDGYLRAIGTSLWLACAATILSLIFGTMVSYALHHRMVPGREAILSLVMAPLVFPAVVIGVALLQFVSLMGLRGNTLILVLAHVLITLPYVVRSAMASLVGINPQIEEAAQVLGARSFTAFRLVTLPLLKPGLMAGCVFSFVTSLDNVPVTIFLLTPRQSTLPVKIYAAVDQGVDPSIAAASTLLIAGAAVALIIAQWRTSLTRFF
ncbi:ABC transporter permease [Acidimangrovimonas sediminis]|uniref:ABC transporter permease n=1 Tax=Acidimangrovimonas sediminis TaxID=2056283 RepID=UPI000C7FF8C2|nr:ABC transporter permease [Acidimangrovimonas sediminis]